MKLRKGDKVKITTGKDKGVEGTIEKVYFKSGLILVDGINFVTKHLKAKGKEKGGIVRVNKPIHASNVMIIDEKSEGKVSRVGYQIVDGKKYRMFKKSKDLISLTSDKK